MLILVCLMLSQSSVKPSSVLFILFPIYCFAALISTILSSRSRIHSSASDILLLIPFRVLLIFVCSLFISYKSLVNIYCIFSIFASILFLRSLIIFTIIILNSFSWRFPISTSFSWFSRALFCSFTWGIILFLFTLGIFLWLWY